MSDITNAFMIPPPLPPENLYIFSFDWLHPGVNADGVNTFITHSRQISSWSYLNAGVYLLRSRASAVDLMTAFRSLTNGARLLVAQITLAGLAGSLPNQAWEWLYEMPPGSLSPKPPPPPSSPLGYRPLK